MEVGWFFGVLGIVLAVAAWLLVKLIGRLRQSAERYRWFELFVCLFLIAWGFLILLGVPRSEWSIWWACFGGASILGGSMELGVVLRSRFRRRAILRCSFCNKSQHDVRKLVAGPGVYICDECVDICVAVIREDRPDPDGHPAGPAAPEPVH